MRKLKLFLDAKAANTPPRGISKASRVIFSVLTLLFLSIGQMWAVDYDLVYTLDGTLTNTGGNSNYAQAGNDVVQSDIHWSVTGNLTQNPWRIGGKNLVGVDREAYSKTAISDNIAKIEIEHGSKTLSAVNSMTVTIASNSDFSTVVSSFSPTFEANKTVTIKRPDGKDWSNCYYKIVYNVDAGNSNSYLQLKSVKFYKEKSASDPVLESITITGDLDNKSYEEGQNIDFAGLTATGNYNDESTADLTDDVEWSFSPALTAGLTSVTVTATLNEISGNKVISGLTVAEHEVTPGTYDISTDNDLWGTSYSGQATGITTLSGSKNDVSITINKNTGSTMYVTSSQTRIYSGYTMIFSVPNGYAITALQFTADGSNWAGEHTADVGTMTDNKNWSGEANSVTISVMGTCRMKAVKVTYAVAAPSKAEAGLAYAEADQKKLVKLGGTFTVPTLTNPHSLTVSYASNNTDVAEVGANGAVTIKAAGVAVITASFDGNDDYKAGSASYTIGVTTHAGAEADPYDVADVKTVIDAMGTMENAYASGIVSNVVTTTLPTEGYITFYFSADGATTGQQIEAYKCYGLNSAPFEALTDVKTGATVVITGTLKKYNSTYEFDANCHLVSYEAPAVPKTHIANDQANPYTVAQAIAYAADGVTYDLDDYVYVQGVVYDVKSFNNGAMNIFIKDANAENQFELYKCAGINDGNATTPFEALTDVQAGNIVIGYGQLTVYNTTYEFKQGNYLVDIQKPATGIELDATAEVEAGSTVNLTATILPSNATGTIVWSVESGDTYASVENGVVTGIAEGKAVIRATVQGTAFYAECTVTVTPEAAPDTRKVANSAASGFTATSGNLEPDDIAFESFRGGNSNNDPIVYNNTKGIRLYQRSGTNAYGNFVTLTAAHGYKIDQVVITTTNSFESTTVAYSVDGNETLSESESVYASGTYSTPTGLNVESINILNTGTGSSGRLEIASIKVYYTGEAATIDHYELGGTYTTEFETGDEFNHDGLIVYAAYDAQGDDKEDITASCTFSEPDMSEAGEKTIEITYKEAVVKSYTINVTEATPDTRKVANGPATFTTIKGDLTPSDIAFEAFKGGSSTNPANYNDGIRLYQKGGSNAFGGYLALTAVKGCAIDQVAITTTSKYATTVAYSIDGNENLLGEEAVAKSGEYTTPAGLNAKNVNILNLGTGSEGRLEIASIKVWYTGDAIAIDHYELGGTYATEFGQYDEFNHEGLIVYAAYDAQGDDKEDITAACTFSEPDMSEAGEKTIEITYKEAVVKSYTITVNASAKEDPAFEYSPASATITAGDEWNAPTLNKAFEVSPISFVSDKPAVATVDENGVITLAGGYGTAVITASFEGDDDYLASEATYTITVNKPAPTPTSTIYRKVTATADITDGEYLIVYEGDATHDAAVFDGSLDNDNIDVAKKVLAVEIENDEIAGNTELDAAVFTIDVTAGSLQSASGLYIGKTDFSNGMDKSTTEAYVNTFAITDGAAVIKGAGNCTLRYNYAVDQLRFRYYKSGQQAIQLYKKETVTPEPEPQYTEVRNGLTEGWYYTMCLDKAVTAVKAGSIWKVLSKAANGNDVILEEAELPLVAGRPYIFLAAASTLEVAYTGDAVGAPVNDDDNNGLVGSFTQQSIEQSPNNFIIYNNALYFVNTDNVYVGANRAYLNMTGVPAYSNEPQQGAPRRRVTMAVYGEQTATGVDAINATDAPVKMMINGQMYILRGEKMYDVTGKLVK